MSWRSSGATPVAIVGAGVGARGDSTRRRPSAFFVRSSGSSVERCSPVRGSTRPTLERSHRAAQMALRRKPFWMCHSPLRQGCEVLTWARTRDSPPGASGQMALRRKPGDALLKKALAAGGITGTPLQRRPEEGTWDTALPQTTPALCPDLASAPMH